MEERAIKAVIICGGCVRDYEYYSGYTRGADLIICADSGVRHAEKLGVTPDILVGDFDSISENTLKVFTEKGVCIYRFPPEKDMTDSELAADMAVQRGADQVVFIGCIGTRLDHSLANIALLKTMLDKGIEASVVDEYNEIRLIDRFIEIEREEGCRLSLLTFTPEVSGITTEGLYYPLNDAVFKAGGSRGISNEFTCERASVTIKKGLLLVIKSRDG